MQQEPSTYFQIYVPPNNDAVQRNVCLVCKLSTMIRNLISLMMARTEIRMILKPEC
jgi:hypothetical protein